jgi:hypothetical protein
MRCSSIRALLLDDPGQLQNGNVCAHLSECAKCRAYASQVAQVDQRLYADAKRLVAPAEAWMLLRGSLIQARKQGVQPSVPLLRRLSKSLQSGDSFLHKPFAFSVFSGAVLLVMLALFVGLVLMRPTAPNTAASTDEPSATPTALSTPSATSEISVIPTMSPTGYIGFTYEGPLDHGIFMIAPGADHPEVLYNDPTWYPKQAVWSPDGSQIVWAGMSLEGDSSAFNLDLYIMDFSGPIRPLVETPGHDAYPTWSPDGTKIAFLTAEDDGPGDIYIINADGSGLTPLGDTCSLR